MATLERFSEKERDYHLYQARQDYLHQQYDIQDAMTEALKGKEEALKAYRMCVKLFEDLFGESPKPITRQLYEDIIHEEKIVNVLLEHMG